ncbi:hypothetical protein [Streptosporangium sp. NPDC051022]|uniref:hypothetical protein n=1 Tax=Streptosporangium sp. NPDC051022 TaxID=3155752 RepID=UPI00341A7666
MNQEPSRATVGIPFVHEGEDVKELIEYGIDGPCEGIMVRGGGDVGVLVLSGSSGRIETERSRLLAGQGVTALGRRRAPHG